MYYPNALRPKGSQWSYVIPLASVTTGCGPVMYWIMVLAAYYVAPFCAFSHVTTHFIPGLTSTEL